MKPIGVIGTGNWGTILAHLIGQNQKPVWLWGRNSDTIQEINQQRTNHHYLKGLSISDQVSATADLQKVIQSCDIFLLAIPSKSLRSVAYEMGHWLRGDQILISGTKGIEEKTFRLMTDILKEETCCKKIGALSGPNIAMEIIQGDPSGAVIASHYEEVIQKTIEILGQSKFKVYGNKDLRGVEIGGALKNIIAIASGIASGLGLGNNSKAFLVTRGIAEIARYGTFWGAKRETFMGLSGIGDLLATCYSPHSRNFTFGKKMSEGKSQTAALEDIKMVVEGMYTTKSVYEFSQKFNIFMPITAGVYRIIYEGAGIKEVLTDLMTARVTYEGTEDLKPFSSLMHMLVHKYPTPETLL